MTLKDELITRYLEQLKFNNYCIPTLRNYSSCVSLFIQYVMDKYCGATITTRHAREYLIFKQHFLHSLLYNKSCNTFFLLDFKNRGAMAFIMALVRQLKTSANC